MGGLKMLMSCFRPNQRSRTSGASTERVESQPANPPGLQRVGSNPARLLSTTPERPEVKPIQGMMWTSGNGITSPMNFSEEPFRPGKLSRTEPDVFPPMHFGRSPGPGPAPAPARAKFWGIPLPFRKSSTTQSESSTIQGSKLKADFLQKRGLEFVDIEDTVMRMNRDLAATVREHSPNYDSLSDHGKYWAMQNALKDHPKFMTVLLHHLNMKARQPTVATATRTMTSGEQTFLTNAFKKVSEDVRNKPFNIHGESAIIGDEKGELTHFHHEPKGTVGMPLKTGDKYNLHTHPPFGEPATSAASDTDHRFAAKSYFEDNNKILTYVTNGKDVLHIQPDSMELVKLIPDPKREKKLGEFPVAFTVPKPAPPPYPFSNHEAPGAL